MDKSAFEDLENAFKRIENNLVNFQPRIDILRPANDLSSHYSLCLNEARENIIQKLKQDQLVQLENAQNRQDYLKKRIKYKEGDLR